MNLNDGWHDGSRCTLDCSSLVKLQVHPISIEPYFAFVTDEAAGRSDDCVCGVALPLL